MEWDGLLDPDKSYYMCSNCFTHIVWLRNCTHVRKEVRIVHTSNPGNLKIEIPENYRWHQGHMLADAKCAGCKKIMGWRYIRVPNSNNRYGDGKFALYLGSLLLWSGYRLLFGYNLTPFPGRKRCRL